VDVAPWAVVRNPLSVRIASGRHFGARQLLAYGLDRALRAAEWLSPIAPSHVVWRVLPDGEPDHDLLARWGSSDACRALAPAWRPALHGDPREGVWCFQGIEQRFEGQVDWQAPLPALWQFNQHYLDTPAALVAAEPDGNWQLWLTALLEDHWLHARPGRGVSWMAYPLAVRVQNLLRVWATLAAVGNCSEDLQQQLARHTRTGMSYLAARLEHHLRGNHLLKELAVLVLAARVWGEQRLLEQSLGSLEMQVDQQFLSGGGHEERSLRYHLDCLRDLLEVHTVLGDDCPSWVEVAVARGLDFAEAMEHPDGDIPLFNDCELESCHPRKLLAGLAGHGTASWTGVRSFAEEGYVAARLGDAHLVVDCGPVGPDHQPAHAHCDILSFELSLGGHRVLGNRGTLAYGSGPDRMLSRSVVSHNTVQLAGEEQVEIWGAFRVGWRGLPELEEARVIDGEAVIAGRYAWHSEVGGEHRRQLRLSVDGSLRIEDQVLWSGSRRGVVARFYFPGASLRESGSERALLDLGGDVLSVSCAGASLRALPSEWFPRQGLKAPAVLVEVMPADTGPQCDFATVVERVVTES